MPEHITFMYCLVVFEPGWTSRIFSAGFDIGPCQRCRSRDSAVGKRREQLQERDHEEVGRRVGTSSYHTQAGLVVATREKKIVYTTSAHSYFVELKNT